ncbi:MAG: hypothetical protein CV045_07835 [Cyanobacteria bacterium M5B4]|nr:MAG: hypothetical protein CV045_07835 [Cyanobacteria bacterium M5B4]
MNKQLLFTTVVGIIIWLFGQPKSNAQIKLRSPIRTWAGSEACLCPYDQVVTKGLTLQFPDEVYSCGRTSAWYRSGGQEPACYLEDMNPRGQSEAMEVERACRAIGFRSCYLDYLNRF